MTDVVGISGRLSKKDLKNLTGTTRSGTVGPTTVYYAGVTAPIISAGVAVFSRSLLQNASYISSYWLFFISTLIAAFSGISWYFIFMRWSYRDTHGRGGEISTHTDLELKPDALYARRGYVTTIIRWDGVLELQQRSGFSALFISGGDTIIIPDHWFDKDKIAKNAFYEKLQSYIQS